MKYSKIILVGYRLTGKSTIGKLLAEKLNFTLYNIDEEIIKKAKKPVSQITQNGSNFGLFRKYELDVLKELVKKENIVISAGGGLGVNNFTFAGRKTYGSINRDVIKRERNMLSVLLSTEEAILEKRLLEHYEEKGSEGISMLTRNKEIETEELITKFFNLYESRKEDYKKMGDLKLDNSYPENTQELLQTIIDKFNDRQ